MGDAASRCKFGADRVVVTGLMLTAALVASATAGWLGLVEWLAGRGREPLAVFLRHWRADAVGALPLVTAGVVAAWLGARRVLGKGTPTRRLRVGVIGAMTGGAGAAGAAVTAAVNGRTSWGGVAALALQALPVALGAGLFGLVVATRRPRLDLVQRAHQRDRWTAVALATVLATSLGAVPAGVAPSAAVPLATDPGNPCPNGAAPNKHFDILARTVDIPLNNYGDHDPQGKMYVLKEVSPAVDEQLAAQKPGPGGSHVSPGLRDDPIQPLVIRANEGDCVEISFTNTMAGSTYGFHIDGLMFHKGSSGDAIGDNPASDSRAGGTQTYRYYIPRDDTLEGAHYMSPGPGYREAVNHGLFGELVVEPPGSKYFDPFRTVDEQDTHALFPTREQLSGQEAMVVPCDGAPFNAAADPGNAANAVAAKR